MLHPNFTPDITLGHLMQALVVLSTVGGYVSLRADLDLQRAEFRVAVARHEARISLAEHQLEQRHTEDRQFQAEMRGALDRVMQAIADLRTEVVQKQNRKQQ
jgi:predicted component of type VI protein secretion system